MIMIMKLQIKLLPNDDVLDLGVLSMSSPDQLDRAEDPHGGSLMGHFGQPMPHTGKIPQELMIKTRIHQRIRLGLLLS